VGLDLGGQRFTAGALTRGDKGDRLTLASDTPAVAGDTPSAIVHLRDGRKASVAVTIAPPRPVATIVHRAATLAAPQGALA
ncbi:hypothetical protein, partial [Clostridium perfringens]